jgi:hypothetical protein
MGNRPTARALWGSNDARRGWATMLFRESSRGRKGVICKDTGKVKFYLDVAFAYHTHDAKGGFQNDYWSY